MGGPDYSRSRLPGSETGQQVPAAPVDLRALWLRLPVKAKTAATVGWQPLRLRQVVLMTVAPIASRSCRPLWTAMAPPASLRDTMSPAPRWRLDWTAPVAEHSLLPPPAVRLQAPPVDRAPWLSLAARR